MYIFIDHWTLCFHCNIVRLCVCHFHILKATWLDLEWAILSRVNCFVQGEVQWFQILLGSLHPWSTGTCRWSPHFSKGKLLRSAWHLIHLAFTQCGLQCLNSSRKMWLLFFRIVSFHTWWYHFDSQQLMQTPFIESINLLYIPLGNCPALRTVQENG